MVHTCVGSFLAPSGPKREKIGNSHLIDHLRNQAEILQDGRGAPAAGLRQVCELWHRG